MRQIEVRSLAVCRRIMNACVMNLSVISFCVSLFGAGLSAPSVDAQTVPPPIGIDCNSNGVDDATDIANGVLDDANQDGVPDNCGLSVMRLKDFAGRSNSIVLATLVVSSPVPVQAVGFTLQFPPNDFVFPDFGLHEPWIEDTALLTSGSPTQSSAGCIMIFDGTPPFSSGLPAGLDVPVASVRVIPANVPDLLPRVVLMSGSLRTVSGQLIVPLTPPAQFQPTVEPLTMRGDLDGSFSVGDVGAALEYLFSCSLAASCPNAVGLNDDGVVTLGDAIDLLSFVFASAPQPTPQ